MSRHHNDGLQKICGCNRKDWPKCRHAWHLWYQWQGTRFRVSLDRERGRAIESKTEAQAYADEIRGRIRAGTFRADVPVFGLTLGDVLTEYKKRYVNAPGRRESGRQSKAWTISLLRRAPVPAGNGATVPLGDKPVAAVTKADVEAFREWRRREHRAMVEARQAWEKERDAVVEHERHARTEARRGWRAIVGESKASHLVGRPKPRIAPGAAGGEVGINRMLEVLRHVFNWAIAEGYTDSTPFKRHGVTVVKMNKALETERTRRLEPGEEEALLAHAEPRLRSLIVAALSTGCRYGELVSLTWGQVRRGADDIPSQVVLPAAKTKTNQNRVIPVGQRLRAELEMRRLDPSGEEYPPEAAVFGEVTGQPIKSIDTAWRSACKRAGIVGLRFHDLRREFGCRLIESGAGLHDAREFLGHANISTTSRYLRASALSLKRAIEGLDRMEAARKVQADTRQEADPGAPPPASPRPVSRKSDKKVTRSGASRRKAPSEPVRNALM